jgi:hypothetical protein
MPSSTRARPWGPHALSHPLGVGAEGRPPDQPGAVEGRRRSPASGTESRSSVTSYGVRNLCPNGSPFPLHAGGCNSVAKRHDVVRRRVERSLNGALREVGRAVGDDAAGGGGLAHDLERLHERHATLTETSCVCASWSECPTPSTPPRCSVENTCRSRSRRLRRWRSGSRPTVPFGI